jgi:calcium-dependent protein kinase
MTELDVNKDGVVDYSEFITAAIDKIAYLNRENLLACFRLIDLDNSGMITINEL